MTPLIFKINNYIFRTSNDTHEMFTVKQMRKEKQRQEQERLEKEKRDKELEEEEQNKVKLNNDIVRTIRIKQLDKVNLDFDSPRLMQAMDDLGVKEEECLKK